MYFPAFGLNADQKNIEYGHFSQSAQQGDCKPLRPRYLATSLFNTNGQTNIEKL